MSEMVMFEKGIWSFMERADWSFDLMDASTKSSNPNGVRTSNMLSTES